MAARNSWAVSAPGGILTTEDSRLHIGALLTPGSTTVKSKTGLRPGGSTAAVSPGLVAAQGTPNKTVLVNAFQAFLQTGRGAGSYIQCLDVNTNIDLLTATPADPSQQRNDLIIAQQNDTTYSDANNTWTVKQVVGTPSGTPVDPTVTGSTDFFTLARVRVTAGATTITNSMIDDLRPSWTVGLGGVLPVKDAAGRATLTPYDGMTIWRIDRKWIETYSISASGWLVQGTAVCTTTSDRDTAITTPYTGQSAFVSADNMEYCYGIPNSGAWTAVQALGGGSSPSAATLHEVRYSQITTGQTIATNTDQRVLYNNAVYGSNDVSTATVSSGTEFTLNRAGLWDISAAIRFTSGTGLMGIFIVDSAALGTRFAGNTASSVLSLSTGFQRRFSAGQKICVLAFQGTGSNQTLDVGFGELVSFSATWVRP